MFRRSSALLLASLLLATQAVNANSNSLQGQSWLDHYRNDINRGSPTRQRSASPWAISPPFAT